MRIAMLLLALGVAACAETPRQAAQRATAEERTRSALDRELAGLVPGAPQSCINDFERRESVTSYGDTLVYRSGATRYVTQTTGCHGIGGNGDNILVTKTTSSQLCRGDIATTVDRTSRFTSGACSFGDFTPYRRAR